MALISAKYHLNLKVAEFISDDGRHLLRSGGTLPWRINNCGDLSSPVDSRGEPAPKKTKNYIGFARVESKNTTDVYQFFIFPDYETGREQLEISLRRKYATSTIEELVAKYAPPGDNDTDKYVRDLTSSTGIASDEKVGDLTEDRFENLVDAIEKIEGYHNEAESRKEVWVPVSTVVATDGARPIADTEIVVRSGGKERTLKSSSAGQFQPIPHKDGPVDVFYKQVNGALKTVGTLAGEFGTPYGLVTHVARFFGSSAPDKAPQPANSSKLPLKYVVQPGDTLSELAHKFKISVAQLKKDNGLKNDNIFSGQQLAIHGKAPAHPARPHAKPSAPGVAKPAGAPESAPSAPTKSEGGFWTNVTAIVAGLSGRSDGGEGKPLALVPPDQQRAPWMTVAFAEAKTFVGQTEDVITKTHNYHRLITDKDRAGGKIVVLRDKKGRPLLDKDKHVRTRTSFDGLSTLVGNNVPWCASFVNYCLREAGYSPGRQIASSFTFGNDSDLFVKIKEPIYGALRFSLRKGGGHICFVYGKIGEKLILLGGNQGDKVCFDVKNRGLKGETFYIPVAYSEFAKTETLPDIDLEALRAEFGLAVDFDDEDVKAKKKIPAKKES